MRTLADVLAHARDVAELDGCRLYVVENNSGICDLAQRFLLLSARDLHNWSVPTRDVVGVAEPQGWLTRRHNVA